jgi:hypothetical protein
VVKSEEVNCGTPGIVMRQLQELRGTDVTRGSRRNISLVARSDVRATLCEMTVGTHCTPSHEYSSTDLTTECDLRQL